MVGHIMLQKNGKSHNFFPGEVSTGRITAIQVSFNGFSENILIFSLFQLQR